MTVSRDWNDPEQVKAYYKEYRQENLERIKQNKREYYLDNRDEILEAQRQKFADKRHAYWKLRNEVFDKLGRKCSKCPFDDMRALQIDGVNGGDSRLRKLYGSKWLKYVLSRIEDFQTLCANCNQIKKHERGEVGRVSRKL